MRRVRESRTAPGPLRLTTDAGLRRYASPDRRPRLCRRASVGTCPVRRMCVRAAYNTRPGAARAGRAARAERPGRSRGAPLAYVARACYFVGRRLAVSASDFESRLRSLLLAEQEHKVRKAKAEAEHAELALEYARRQALPALKGEVLS